MKRLIMIVLISIISVFKSQALSFVSNRAPVVGKPCSITRVYKHDGSLSDKYVFHFAGNPVCTYIPKNINEKDVQAGKPVHLTFFVPLATLKNGSGKKAIEEMNQAKCSPDYCVRVKSVTSPMKGIEYNITLILGKRGLEYQSFTSITGERGVMFKFHNQEALKRVH